MKKIKIFSALFSGIIILAVILVSCKKETQAISGVLLQHPDLPANAYNYSKKHDVNSDLATLGRVLFYDRNLSVNNDVSCGSCHKQEFAFADNVRFNKGFNGVELKRNSPSIQGIRGFGSALRQTFFFGPGPGQGGSPSVNQSNFASDNQMPTTENQREVLLFWDARQKSVADMVLNPVLNHKEMNSPDFETLIAKLSKLDYYGPLFTKAFGSADITKEKIAFALEGFLACLNTESDSLQQAKRFSSFQHTPGFFPNGPQNIVEEGEILFHTKYNCATCHDPSSARGYYGVNNNTSTLFNIGLDEVYADNGLAAITSRPGDEGLFKVPSLKNISVTGPYMHDGRFSNLNEVLDHYSHNIKPNRNLSPLFTNFDGTPKKLNILPAEKLALIAFLNSLKDDDFLTSPMYSDPFKK